MRALKARLVERLVAAREALSDEEARDLVLEMIRDDLNGQVARYADEQMGRLVSLARRLVGKVSGESTGDRRGPG
ncbi:MAG: hypothetical protein MZU95_12150 [Desulfomicrobium escambiense]|nr:hypothetical protein [Desulfomicrobium escambiense]